MSDFIDPEPAVFVPGALPSPAERAASAPGLHVFACWRSDRHGPLFCRWTAPHPLGAAPAVGSGASDLDRFG